jgi:D-alanine-D-alanine ligase-like ATP-grasp enzyme
MLKVSSSLPDVAILRGGHKHFKQSLQDGGEVLSSLKKIGYDPVDVLIEKDGTWTQAGAPTDPHSIFTKSHTIIDTTKLESERYHDLAKRMGIHLHFTASHEVPLDRESVYRLLRQQNIKVPSTFVIRSTAPLNGEVFRSIWTKYHTPLLVRPLKRRAEFPSRVVKMFAELEAVIRDYHEKGVDLHVLTYRGKIPVSSLAVLHDFRGEETYTPLWVDVFPEDNGLPHGESQMRPHLQAPDFRKEHMKDVATKVYKALGVKTPVCIDFINHNDEQVVVNVDFSPSLRKDSRFMKSLATTGVDVGQYIHGCIHNELER